MRLFDRFRRRPDPPAVTGSEDEGGVFREIYDRGYRAFRAGQLEAAHQAFSLATTLRPDDPCSWEMMGCTLCNLGRFEESLRAFDRLGELGHECANCWFSRWVAYCGLRRYEEGLEFLERGLELHPDHAQRWCERGLVLGGLWTSPGGGAIFPDGRFEEAVVSFDRALALDAGFHQALVGKGLVLYRMTLAAQALARALVVSGVDAWPDYEDAFRRARAALDRAIANRPDDPWAWLHKGDLLVDLENSRELDEEALEAYTKAVELAPDHAQSWYSRAGVCLRLGDRAGAVDSLRRAVNLVPIYRERAEQEYGPLLEAFSLARRGTNGPGVAAAPPP